MKSLWMIGRVALLLVSLLLLSLILTTGEGGQAEAWNPLLTKTVAVLFEDDFDDRIADGWALDPGWGIVRDGGNHVLSGSGHQCASPIVSGWTDYTIKARFRLLSGGFLFNFRQGTGGVHTRYGLAIHQEHLHLFKQIGEDFWDLIGAAVSLRLRRWHTVKIVLEGSEIKIYLNDALRISFTDVELPLRTGGFAFETLEDSHVHFDDITVTGVKFIQAAKWVKTGGPLGGIGYDVRIHPRDKNIMFVTDDPSGVQKSYDSGATWAARNEGITARSGPSGDGIPIFSLTIDPNNPDIVWVGTQGMRGIFKSVDGGESWLKKDNGVTEWNEITFRGFAIRPGNSNVVLAAAEIHTGIQGELFERVKGKIYKTIDGGKNWYPVWEGDSLARVIIFDPTNSDIVYTSTGIFDREAYNVNGEGVLKSVDGGETWFPINKGLGKNLFIGFLDMHPTDSQILVAAAGNETLQSIRHHRGGVYMTYDGGEHWQKIFAPGDIITVAAFSPSNPDIMYAGSEIAFYRSENGGVNWRQFNKPEEGCYGPPGIKPGIPISIVIDPDDPMTLFVNNYDGGVFKSTDGAETWVDSSRGYSGATVWDIAIDPHNRETVYATNRASIFRSTDAGESWEGLAFIYEAREPYAITVKPDNPRTVLIGRESEVKILKSVDSGDRWRVIFHQPQSFDPGNRIGVSTITYAPSNTDIIYVGTRRSPARDSTSITGEAYGIFKSTDGGETWIEANGGLESSSKNINVIVVHPDNPNIAYTATTDQGVLKTLDGGERWHTVNNGLMSLVVESLAIDPQNPEVVFAGLGEGVGIFRTTNGGELWEGINYGIRVECPSFLLRVGQVRPGISLVRPGRPMGDFYSMPWTSIRSIVIDPINPQVIYAADFSLGVYLSTDGGHSWNPINKGLSTRAVQALVISADGRVLYAATSGEGVFRLSMEKGTLSVRVTHDGRPVEGATVLISSREEFPLAEVIQGELPLGIHSIFTDADGEAMIDLTVGEYNVLAFVEEGRADNLVNLYLSDPVRIAIAADETTAIDLPLITETEIEMVLIATRTLKPDEYRIIYDIIFGALLRLENLIEPENAEGVRVVVTSVVNGVAREIEETVDIKGGRSSKDIKLGEITDDIRIKTVKIIYLNNL